MRWVLAVVLLAWIAALGLGAGQGMFSGKKSTCPKNARPSIVTITKRQKMTTTAGYYFVQDTAGCIFYVTAARFPVYTAGDVIEIHGGQWQDVVAIPDEYQGYRNYLLRQQVIATIRYPRIEIQTTHTTVLSTWYQRLSQRIDVIFNEPEASVARALVLGDQGSLDENLLHSFRVTGVSHILSISGLHLSLIAGLLVLLLSLLPLSPWWRTGVVLLLLYGYVALIGWPVAALRALLFWTVTLLALRLGWLTSLTMMLLLTCAIITTANPLLWFDVSWQLSCSAVVGIGGLLFLTRPYQERCPRRLSWLITSLLVSIGALLTTWPLVAYHFQIFSLISIVANLAIVPLSTVLLLLGSAALATSPLFMPLSLLCAYIFHVILALMTSITSLLSRVPGGYHDEIVLSLPYIALYYLLLVVLSILWLHWQRRSWREVWV